MYKFTNVIEKFVNKMGDLENKNVEGIVFYGSSQTGFSNDFSDIDLHINLIIMLWKKSVVQL